MDLGSGLDVKQATLSTPVIGFRNTGLNALFVQCESKSKRAAAA
jgi:hypothetical protein